MPRGEVMGGSSTVNGGVFVRATPATSMDGRRSATTNGRSPRCCRSSNGMEDDRDFPDGEFHGTGGPVPVSRTERLRIAPVEQGVRLGLLTLWTFPKRSTRTRRAHRDAGACR